MSEKILVSFDTDPVKGLFAEGVISKKKLTLIKRLMKKYGIGEYNGIGGYNGSYVYDLTISGKPANDIFNISIVEKVVSGYYPLIKNLDAVDQILIPMLQVFIENEKVSDTDFKIFGELCDE